MNVTKTLDCMLGYKYVFEEKDAAEKRRVRIASYLLIFLHSDTDVYSCDTARPVPGGTILFVFYLAHRSVLVVSTSCL